jgi:hypothetical protein
MNRNGNGPRDSSIRAHPFSFSSSLRNNEVITTVPVPYVASHYFNCDISLISLIKMSLPNDGLSSFKILLITDTFVSSSPPRPPPQPLPHPQHPQRHRSSAPSLRIASLFIIPPLIEYCF